MSSALVDHDRPKVALTPSHLVSIGSIATRIESITTTHDVDNGVGQCTLRLPAMFAWVVVGANVDVHLGYAETGLSPAFIGTVRRVERAFNGDRGWEMVVTCDGQLARLVDEEEVDLAYPKIYLGDLVTSLTDRRGITPVQKDRIKSSVDWLLDKNWIILGGNRYVDDGGVIVPAKRGLYAWLSDVLELFGYRIFDRPMSDVKVGRISGAPLETQHSATEGVDIFEGRRPIDLSDMITYWTVEGSSYTDDDGVPIKFRSIPAEVPADDRLRPRRYRSREIGDSILSSQFLVDTVRETMEIDYSQPSDRTSWEMPGNIAIQPGDAIRITSEVLGHSVSDDLWITNVRHQYSDQGFWTTIEAWAGHGVALEHGDDAVSISVVSAPVHVGDEYVAWYASPNPSSKEVVFNIDVPGDYTAMMIEYWSHGCNSYFIDGASDESTVSSVTVEQGDEEIGSAELPMQPENYEMQYPYGASLDHWTFVRIPVPGNLETGAATIRIKSGEDNRLPGSTAWDDFEIQNMTLKLTGVGKPILPTPKG